MAALEIMVGTQLKSYEKPLATFKALVGKIELYHVLGIMYVAIAITMAVSETEGVIGWFYRQTGVPADAAAVIFSLCGLAFLFKPGARIFVICLIPLIIYLVIATAFVLSNDRFSLTTTWFVVSTMLFMAVLHFKQIGSLNIRHVFCSSMMILGITIFLHPDRGTAAWLHERWLWLPAELFGLLLILAACYVAIVPTVNAFLGGMFILAVYGCASLMFAAFNAGAVAAMITVLTIACICWAYIKASDYITEAK